MRTSLFLVLLGLVLSVGIADDDLSEEIPKDTPACLMMLEVRPTWMPDEEREGDCSEWNVGHGTGTVPLSLNLKLVGQRSGGNTHQIRDATIWLREPFWDDVSRIEIRANRPSPFPMQIELKRSTNMTCQDGKVRSSDGIYPYVAYIHASGCKDKMVLIDQDMIQEIELDCERE